MAFSASWSRPFAIASLMLWSRESGEMREQLDWDDMRYF
jgi:hypothetical protein